MLYDEATEEWYAQHTTTRLNNRTRKVLAPMKKTLTYVDGVLTAQRVTDARPQPDKNVDTTFGFFQTQDGKLGMGNKVYNSMERL